MLLKGPFIKSRQLAIGKTLYVRELRGQLIACKWPRRRTRPTNETTIEQMEKFRQANWAAKYAPAEIQIAYTQLVKGTQLLPRDLMVAAMYGRGFTWLNPNHRRRYPVVALRDLSDTLDILGSNPGDIIVRGIQRWEAIVAPSAGLILTSSTPGNPPSWLGVPPGSGVWQQIADTTLAATLGIGVYHQVAIPAQAKEVEWNLWIPAPAITLRPVIRLNNNSGANYFSAGTGTTSLGAAKAGRFVSETELRLIFESATSAAARTVARGRIWQADIAERIGVFFESNYGGTVSYNATGQYAPPASAILSQVGFASNTGQGLPAGTRIITRIAV